MANRRADAVLFGFDFQVNAAIVLMLENIKDATALRLESANEDIEIFLSNGHSILAQAKSVVQSSSDFTNVRKNLKKSLLSLAEGAQKVEADQLIMITNSPNPLKEDASRSAFWGHAIRSFDSLPDSSKRIITNYISDGFDIDTSKLTIQVLPFETDDERERYKAVMQVINDFIGDIGLRTPGIGKQLHDIWRLNVFSNGSKKDETIKLSKPEFIWPIIVIETDIANLDETILNNFDEALYEELTHRYHETIDACCEKFEFVTRVLSDYNQYNSNKSSLEKCWDFAENKWNDYFDEFNVDSMDSETAENLTKVILYSVVKRRIDIDRIKRGTGL